MGESPDVITQHMKEHPEVAGVVTGDHVRLRQVITNLARYALRMLAALILLTILHEAMRRSLHRPGDG
jgi:C4-dicarboxylate-specific signal transduction histidine kinase